MTETLAQRKAKMTLATFNSSDPGLRLVRIPTRRKMNERGEWETYRGETHVFKRGRFVVTAEDEDKYPGLIEWLRSHKSFGKFFFEPDTPMPMRVGEDSSEVLKEIMRLAAAGDADGIADIWVAEKNDQSRLEVLAACEEGIELTDPERQPEPEEIPAHQIKPRVEGPHKGPKPGAEPVAAEEGADSSQAAEELAVEHGIDIAEIEGTGKDGRVTKPDVEAFIEHQTEPESVNE